MSKSFLIVAKLLAAVGLLLFLLTAVFSVRLSAAAAALPAPSAVPTAAPVPEATPEPAAELTSEPTPEPTPEPAPEPTEEHFLISMVGDCTLASYPEISGYGSAIEQVVNGDWSYPFSHVADLFSADEFTLANLECSLTDQPAWSGSRFSFRAPAAAAEVLKKGSVEFVNTANNHAMDFGQAIYDDTLANLDAAGIGYTGEGEKRIWETEHGLCIGVFSAYNGFYPDKNTVVSGINALKAQQPDVIIVSLHWGVEGSYYQSADQTAVAHAAIDAGADIVFGHHPHRLQPMEIYNGRYIFYSMGNFCFGGNTLPSDMDTAIAQVEVIRQPDGAVSLGGYKLLPCSISSSAEVNDYCPTLFEEGTDAYERALSKISGTFSGANSNIDYSFMDKSGEGDA